MSEVMDALRALQAGERTVEDVEDMFRTRNWPKPTTTRPTTGAEALARDSEDPEEPVDGSFFEVADAFTRSIIDIDTYERLATAASEAMTAPQGTPDPPEDPEQVPDADAAPTTDPEETP